jgi:hypothetical protein
MNKCRRYGGSWTSLVCAVLVLSFLPRAAVAAVATEETFPTLEVGSHVYTNVTVTTKAKNYIFIYHSTGMANIRLADLPDEIRAELGYVPELTKKEKATAWAKSKLADLKLTDINFRDAKAAQLVQQKLQEQFPVAFEKVRALDRKFCGAIMGGILLIHLLFSYCCLLICQKAKQEPGLLIWLPVLQAVPLLRAARMSPAWFVLSILIVPGIIGGIVWCFKIAKARGKSAAAGFFLLPFLPTSPLVFLYLAFADKIPTQPVIQEDRRTDHLMTLETA